MNIIAKVSKSEKLKIIDIKISKDDNRLETNAINLVH